MFWMIKKKKKKIKKNKKIKKQKKNSRDSGELGSQPQLGVGGRSTPAQDHMSYF